MKHSHRTLLPLFGLLLLASLLCSACRSHEHMYRHPRSQCDCPTF